MEVVMHDALTGVALLIGLVAGAEVTLRLTADPAPARSRRSPRPPLRHRLPEELAPRTRVR
jgi:hypothetical protein